MRQDTSYTSHLASRISHLAHNAQGIRHKAYGIRHMRQDTSYTSHLASGIWSFREIITLYTLTQRCVTWRNNCNKWQQALQRGLKRQAAMRAQVEILFNLLVYLLISCVYLQLKGKKMAHSPTTSPQKTINTKP